MVFVLHLCSDVGLMSTIPWINLWVHLNSAISGEDWASLGAGWGAWASLLSALQLAPSATSTDTSNLHLLGASEGRLYEGNNLCFFSFNTVECIRPQTVCHAKGSRLLPEEPRKEVLVSIQGE